MKLRYILYSLTLGTVLTGCNDGFLERAPQEITDQTFWNTATDLQSYANAFYDNLPSGVDNLGDTNADDQVPNSVNTFNWGMYTVPAENGEWSKDDWLQIRRINYFMTHYQTATGSEVDINRVVAQMRFFRAMEYFAKVRTFGDVPWIDKDLNVDDTDILYGPRTPRNEVVQHIIEDLNFAIQWLREGRVDPSNNLLTQDVAYHLKARVCLYEGTYYKYHTELGLTAQADDLLRQAAEASDSLINSGRYDIYSTGDPEHDYYNLFMLDDKSNLNEAVLYIDYNNPLRFHNAARGGFEGNCGFSKDFVDRILYADGLPKALTSYPTGDETLAEELANRDPRARQLIMNDAFCTETDPAWAPVTDDWYVRQYCQTGYSTMKYWSQTQFNTGQTMQSYDGIAYRYAETLLINAEAKAELGTLTQSDLDKTINKLRDRVAMPHLTMEVGFTDPNWPEAFGNISAVLQEIRRERSIELAGEGFRWDDICRWKAGELLNNVMTYVGKKISPESSQAQEGLRSDEGYIMVYPNYTNPDLSYTAGKSRTWEDKLYLYPIPLGEIQRNPNLEQNPGW